MGQVAFVKSELKIALLDVEQMLVRRRQNGNVSQCGFRQDQSVVKFVFGQKLSLNEPPRKLLRDSVADRFEIVRLNAPVPQILQSSQSPFCFAPLELNARIESS